MAKRGNEFHSLKEAKDSESPDWPECENAIRSEQDQLEKETWELVEKLADAVPLSNKWVFVKKWDEGQIVKNKARLVVKGSGQRPEFDYLETYSPVSPVVRSW
jgi:hypothetical protein